MFTNLSLLPSLFSYALSFKLYFIDYAITIILIFPPLPALHQVPPLLQVIPHLCWCPWVMHIRSLATPFPIMYFTSPWLFCNYLFVLHPLTSSSSPLHIPPSGNHQNTLCIHDSVSLLLVCLVCFLESTVNTFVFFAILLFIVLIFFFLTSPFNISYNNGLVMMNSYSVFLSGKIFISPSIQMIALLGRAI